VIVIKLRVALRYTKWKIYEFTKNSKFQNFDANVKNFISSNKIINACLDFVSSH